MNTRIPQICACLLAAGAASAFAVSETPAPQVVEVIARPAALAAAQSVLARQDIDTRYSMSSGRQMVVLAQGDALTVRYGRRAPATLMHDGRGRFVSRDGKLELQFALDARGDAEHVRLSMPVNWQ